MTEPLTELTLWEAGLLEGVVQTTAEDERAEAVELARDLESFGYRVR